MHDTGHTPDQAAREPAAGERAQIGGEIRQPGENAHFGQREAALLHQVFRHPEEVEPPHGVGEEAGQQQPPDFPLQPEARPGGPGTSLGGVWRAADQVQFGGRDEAMLLGQPVQEQPERQPHKAERTGGHECEPPAVAHRDPCNQRRGDHRADRRARVHQAVEEGPLLRRVPFRREASGSHVVAGLAHA